MICSLVGERADAHQLSADGNTLLHATVLAIDDDWGSDVVEVLVSAGCNPSVYNRQGKTSLHIAVEKGSICVMEYILSLDQSLPDDILFSVLKSEVNINVTLHMLITLVIKGSNARAVAADGNNLLHVAISSSSYNRLHHDYVYIQMIVEILVESGCDAFACNSLGKTPLHLAVAAGHVAIVEYLLQIVHHPHLMLPFNITLSYITQPYLPVDILACLLEGEFARTNWGDTYVMLLLLIENGANIHARTVVNDGLGTLLQMVIKNALHLQTLPRSPSTPSLPPLEGAAWWIEDADPFADWLRPTRTHRQSSLPSEVPGDDVDTELQNLVDTLSQVRRDTDILRIVSLLVDSGCDPSQCDVDGHPPLYFAVLRGHVRVVGYLLPITVPPPRDLWHATNSVRRDIRGELRAVLTRWAPSGV
ncbi:ankyrin [Imleria badia]|nr:ankyrin [Imleria badia]